MTDKDLNEIQVEDFLIENKHQFKEEYSDYTKVFEALIRGHLGPIEEDVYFRPMLCFHTKRLPKVFLIGLNPATPIYRENIPEEQYIEKLLSYSSFQSYYEAERMKKGKTKKSPTRKRMEEIVKRIWEETGEVTLETNVFSYPTREKRELRAISPSTLEESKHTWIALLYDFQPTVLAVHGKSALKEVTTVLKDLNMIDPITQIKLGEPIEFFYKGGQRGILVSYRHLSRIEKTSFEKFQQCILEKIMEATGN